jgi:multidrug efflux pump subunit AcrA (membrane-fusion protein)
MRVFVRVPEVDAVWVRTGAAARVRVQGLQGEEFAGTVARTSYSLDPADRTLLAEIDLSNARDRLRPGMYAYAAIIAELPDALTLPTSAVLTQGSITQGFEAACFVLRDGKVWRTPVQVGFSDGRRIEVLKKQSRPASQGSEAVWQEFPADETVVQDNLSQLTDGQPVSARRL